MLCMKCGKETADSQVFCDDCLRTMEQYPVKQDTPIHLPHRSIPVQPKKQPHRKRLLTPEEQVVQLKKLVRRLIVCVAILCIVLCLATAFLFKELWDDRTPQSVGRNYTINTSQQTD